MGGEKQMVDVLDSTTEMEGGQTRTLGIETAMCSDHLGFEKGAKVSYGPEATTANQEQSWSWHRSKVWRCPRETSLMRAPSGRDGDRRCWEATFLLDYRMAGVRYAFKPSLLELKSLKSLPRGGRQECSQHLGSVTHTPTSCPRPAWWSLGMMEPRSSTPAPHTLPPPVSAP